jgi:hypothetical protein
MLMVALLARGLGLGVVMIPLMTAAFIGLDREHVPHASIVTRIAQQIGGSAGVAVLAVILTTSTTGTGSRAAAFDVTFWWTIGFTTLAVLLSLLLPGRRAAAEPAGALVSVPSGR